MREGSDPREGVDSDLSGDGLKAVMFNPVFVMMGNVPVEEGMFKSNPEPLGG